MKKILIVLMTAVMMAGCLTGCGGNTTAKAAGKDRIRIVTTVFPEYDWVMSILGDNPADAEVVMLLDNGVDLHSYQPTADDIMKISDCDMFIYVGGESDEWVEDALKEAVNKDMAVINLLEVLGDSVKEEEVVEGMQEEEHEHEHEDGDEEEHEHEGEDADEHEHEHEHEEEEHEHEDEDEHEHEHEEEEEIEYDEHVWLSVSNAKLICGQITDKLCALDTADADTYKANLTAYSAELDKLDADFREVISAAPVKTVVFGDRFPFRYFTEDYGLDYYAAFAGCSAETEASFETVVFLANKLDELGVKTIYTIENSDGSIARTIINSTKNKDQNIAALNSIQSVKSAEAESGTTYISLMRENLEVLKNTLK